MGFRSTKWNRRAALLLLCLAGFVFANPAIALEVIAGTGAAGYSGEGELARNTPLNRPQAVVEVPDGSLYIADAGNRRVRAVDTNGIISLVAGDGAAPQDAFWNGTSLGFPAGLALDSADRLWIADAVGQRLLRLTPNGLERVAGTGQERAAALNTFPEETSLLYPIALLPQEGGVLLSEMGTDRILSISEGNPLALRAGGIPAPAGLARDVDGALLIAAFGDGSVYRVTEQGTETAVSLPVPTLDGDPLLSVLPLPSSVAVGREGSLYIAVPDAATIYRLTPDGDLLPFLASPDVLRPVGLSITRDSRLLIADEGRHQVLSAPLPFPAPLPGDLDGDEAVTVNDGVMALRLAVGLAPFHRRRFLAADVAPRLAEGGAGDRRVNVEDVVLILRRSVGLETF